MGYRFFAMTAVTFALSAGVVGCSTFKKVLFESQQVELMSDPLGAEVLSLSGEKLGVTPFVLEGEALKKVKKNGQINILLSAPGFMQREVLIDLHGKDSHEIRLSPYPSTYFSERLIQDFPVEANAMARGLAEIQSLVFARKLVEAERGLEAFQRRFPNIAATYVLFASVESLRGNHDKARRYLLRARTLDPTDPVANRMLKQRSESAARQPAQAPAAPGQGGARP